MTKKKKQQNKIKRSEDYLNLQKKMLLGKGTKELLGLDNTEILKKGDIQKLISNLRLLLKTIMEDVKNQEILDDLPISEILDTELASSSLRLRYRPYPEVIDSIDKYQQLNEKLYYLEEDFRIKRISPKRYNLLRSIIIDKIGHLIHIIGMSVYVEDEEAVL